MNSKFYNKIRESSRLILDIMGFSIEGIQNIRDYSGAKIFSPNHPNWKDIFFIGCTLKEKLYFVGTTELFDKKRCREMTLNYFKEKNKSLTELLSPLINLVSDKIVCSGVKKLGNVVPVEMKGSSKKSLEGFIRTCVDVLKEGKSLCIFPRRWTKVNGEKNKKMMPGIGMIAHLYRQETGKDIPIFPVYLRSSKSMFMKTEGWGVKIGKPVDPMSSYMTKKNGEGEKRFYDFFTHAQVNEIRQWMNKLEESMFFLQYNQNPYNPKKTIVY